jgi:hypothetical protein
LKETEEAKVKAAKEKQEAEEAAILEKKEEAKAPAAVAAKAAAKEKEEAKVATDEFELEQNKAEKTAKRASSVQLISLPRPFNSSTLIFPSLLSVSFFL